MKRLNHDPRSDNWLLHAVLIGALVVGWFVLASSDGASTGINAVGDGILVFGLALGGLVHAIVSTVVLALCVHRRHATLLVHGGIILALALAGLLAFGVQALR